MTSQAHLIVKNLSKQFGAADKPLAVFENLNLEVRRGEFLCIVGPSGCGKSTLLRSIAGLDKASDGEIIVAHERENNLAPKLGMVFQEHALFPWMTISENLRFIIANNQALKKSAAQEIAQQYLAKVGLADFTHFYPHQLSGGMRQRVSIARSFVINPELLLMDEPFVFLDFQTRMQLHQLLLSIWLETRKTVVFVTHDIEEAVLLADRILVMSRRPSTIKAQYHVELARPRDFLSIKKNQQYLDLVEAITLSIQEELNIDEYKGA